MLRGKTAPEFVDRGRYKDGYESDIETEADEGYASYLTYEFQNEEDEEEESSEEDEEEESSEEDEEDESSEEDDNGKEESEDEADESGNEKGHGLFGHWPPPALRLKPNMNCSPAQECKSKNKSKKDQNPRPSLRRRSSRF
jgi:hypothetical protein